MQASRHQPSCDPWLHPQRGAGTLLKGHTQGLSPHSLLSATDLQHQDGPRWLLNLQSLSQLVELLLLSKTLIYLPNAMTNDKASGYSGLFVISRGVNVPGKQCLIHPSANGAALSRLFTGRAHFPRVSLLWRYWERFCGRYLHRPSGCGIFWAHFTQAGGPGCQNIKEHFPQHLINLSCCLSGVITFPRPGRLTNPPWTINLGTAWTKRDFCKNRPQRMHWRQQALRLLQLLDLFWLDFFTNGED